VQEKIQKIREKFSDEFFRKVSQYLIDIYKTKEHSGLKKIGKRVLPGSIETLSFKKLFYSLIKIFHPDSIKMHQKEFENAVKDNRKHIIDYYSRLISVQIHKPLQRHKGFSYTHKEEYAFDRSDEDMFFDSAVYDSVTGDDIISILSFMFLGNSSKILEPVDLGQIEGELVLGSMGLSDLEGIQYCKRITFLDLSGNSIDNIYEIGELDQLEELDLSDNLITDLEPLRGLHNLETLYIDNNQIEDISVLTELENLKFVSLTGNPVTGLEQIYALNQNDVVAVYY
jgi:hypothetical protein